MHHFFLVEKIVLSVLIFLSLVSFSYEIFKRFKIILKGRGQLPTDKILKRFYRVFEEFVLFKKVLQQRFIPYLMHAFVFWDLWHFH